MAHRWPGYQPRFSRDHQNGPMPLSFLAAPLLSLALGGAAAPALERTTWTLTSPAPQSADIPSPTLQLSGSKVSGFAGCNQYQATVRRQGGRLSIGQLSLTRRLCEPARMKLEQGFIESLGHVKSYQQSGQTLTLIGGKQRLVFRAAPTGGSMTPISSPDLNPAAAAGEWKVVSLQVGGAVSVPAAAQLTLQANGNGLSLAGILDCNRITARGTLGGERLTFTQYATTRMLCENMQGERALGKLLGAPVQVSVQGEQMTWKNSLGELTLRRVTPTPATVSAAQLSGRTFTLLGIGGKKPVTDAPLTLTFTGGRVGGYDGCNHFGAAYAIGKGGELLLTGPLTSTLVACSQETPDLTRLLGAQPRLTLSGKTLTLSSGGVNWGFEEK